MVVYPSGGSEHAHLKFVPGGDSSSISRSLNGLSGASRLRATKCRRSSNPISCTVRSGIRCALNRTQFAKDVLVEQFAQPLLFRSYGSNSRNLATSGLRPFVNSAAKHFEDVMSFLPGCPLSA
jgi:hypothetical protein